MAGFDLDDDRRRADEPGGAPPERASEAADPLAAMASTVGNRAFAGLVARVGAGILPGGVVHPDVEAAIARRRGGGAPLDPGTREHLSEGLGDPLGDVRVHTGSEPDRLARSVAARAFTTGPDIYFAQGEYRPGSAVGDELIAHEAAHVVQQRGLETDGPLMVSEPGDPVEVDAEAATRELAG